MSFRNRTIPLSISGAILLCGILLGLAFFGGSVLNGLATDLTLDQYMPRGACMRWEPTLVAMHAASDLLIAFAYYAIPVILMIAVRIEMAIRDDPDHKGNRIYGAFEWVMNRIAYKSGMPWAVRLRMIAINFAGFIVLCGTGHIWDLVSIWHAVPWFKGVNNVFTAYFSIATGIEALRHLPYFIKLVRQMAATRKEFEL